MQSVSSRIWTWVAVSISFDDDHYTTGTSAKLSSIDVNLIINNNFDRIVSNLVRISKRTLERVFPLLNAFS